MKMRLSILALVVVCAVTNMSAQARFDDFGTGNSVTATAGSNSATITVNSFNTTTNQANITCSGTATNDNLNWYYYASSGPGNVGAFLANFRAAHAPGAVSPSTTNVTMTPGGWYVLVASAGDGGAIPSYTEVRGRIWYQAGGVPPSNKVTITLPINKSDKDKVYRLYQGGVLQGSVTLAPGQGLIQTFTVPAGTDVTVVELVSDMVKDGPTWVASPGTVTETAVGTATPTSVPSGGSDPAPSPITPNNVQPENTVTPETDKQVWTATASVTSGTSDFTVKAYREGVDKIVGAITGEKLTETTPVATSPSSIFAPDAGTVTGAMGKLPSAPTITTVTPLTALSVNLELKKIDGSAFYTKNIAVNFASAPYATAVTIFRNICLAIIGGIFFFLGFNAVRSAFVGK